jgi:hypothetical protein
MCLFEGEEKFRKINWVYGFYNNDKIITDHQRKIYRNSLKLQDYFKDPFNSDIRNSYLKWYNSKKYHNKFFDWKNYLDYNPDLLKNWNSSFRARVHYILFGKREKRRYQLKIS